MIILDGSVRVHQHSPDSSDTEVDLCVMGEWDSIGETALCLEENTRRTASCSTMTDVEALVLPKDSFRKLAAQQEDTYTLLASSGSERIDTLKKQDRVRHGTLHKSVSVKIVPRPPPNDESLI